MHGAIASDPGKCPSCRSARKTCAPCGSERAAEVTAGAAHRSSARDPGRGCRPPHPSSAHAARGGTPIPLPGWVPALPASCPPQPPQHHDGAAQTRSAGRLAVGCSAGEASQARHGPENWGRSASPPVFLPAVGHAHPRCLARIVPRCRRWDGRRGARRQV